MIAVLVISSAFMVVIFIAIFIFALHIKRWAVYKETETQKRFDRLTERIDETQRLFREDVSKILNSVKSLIDK